MEEARVQGEIFLEIGSLPDTRLFRNTVGLGFHGQKLESIYISKPGIFKIPKGYTLLKHSRPVKFGLFKGSSDLVGYTKKTITPDMVGKTVAIFTSIEVKANEKKKSSPEQKNWIQKVLEWGGFAGVAHNSKTAQGIIDKRI